MIPDIRIENFIEILKNKKKKKIPIIPHSYFKNT